MKVLITGATGYIGSTLVQALHRAGHSVTALVRSEQKFRRIHAIPVQTWQGDVKQPDSYRQAVAESDAIVLCSAEMSGDWPEMDRVTLDTVLPTAAEAGGQKIVVYTSGVWTLGATGDQPADEHSSTEKGLPLVQWRAKHEQRVLEAGQGQLFTAVVRPGMVYGGTKGLFPAFFETAARDSAANHVGDGQNRWATVHVRDVSDLYARVIDLAFSERLRDVPRHQRIFHAVDGMHERVVDIAAAASRAAGEGGKTKAVPLEEARKHMGQVADALAMDQVIVARHTERLLGWRPRYRGFVRNVIEVFEEWGQSL